MTPARRRPKGRTRAKAAKRGAPRRRAGAPRASRRRPPFALLVGLAFLGGTAVVVALTWGAEVPEDTVLFSAPEGRIRVEVLNQGGVTGMARDATEWLRGLGFDVVDIGNAESFDPERASAVIDRVGRPVLARAVADALGIGIVLSQPDSNLYVDVSVLLGSEWTRPDPGAGSSGAPERAPWDPRGWIGL